MSDIVFGRLDEVEPRLAWTHEALNFTPWLAENLDRLSDALGIGLELDAMEVPVGRYAADILARNAQDGTPVLIENQLEFSDHGHLGQILTYLTGLAAKTVVWIAPRFREEHLSALRWLNENTADKGFAFFAVRLRVVRIGASPLAPLLEVLERPNGWDRQLHETAKNAVEMSPEGIIRKQFWTEYLHADPDLAVDGPPQGIASRWYYIPGNHFVIGQWFSKDFVGVFIRGHRNVQGAEVLSDLACRAQELERDLGVGAGGVTRYPYLKKLDADTSVREDWPRLINWLQAQLELYVNVLTEYWPIA